MASRQKLQEARLWDLLAGDSDWAVAKPDEEAEPTRRGASPVRARPL